jgi:hypothetical protein
MTIKDFDQNLNNIQITTSSVHRRDTLNMLEAITKVGHYVILLCAITTAGSD